MRLFPTCLAASLSCALSLFCQQAGYAQTGAADFEFTVAPSQLILAPGKTAGFLVTVENLNGFNAPVTLAAKGLPVGVSAAFAPQIVNPPGTSVLTLSADAQTSAGPFPLSLQLTGGGITHTTTNTVTVQFGLVPACYGTFRGTVSDFLSGAPIAGAQVSWTPPAISDANGHFIITNVPLEADNAPRSYIFRLEARGYQPYFTNAYAVCDTVTEVDAHLYPFPVASITGNVTDEIGSLITNVQISINTATNPVTLISPDGHFHFDSLPFSSLAASITASRSDFWPTNVILVLQTNQDNFVNIQLVRICYHSIHGQVILQDTGLPAVHALVTLDAQSLLRHYEVRTDNDGRFDFPAVIPSADNASVSYALVAGQTGYFNAETVVTFSGCGGPDNVGVLTLTPVAHLNTFGVQGHVFDLETSQPLVGAEVDGPFASQRITDATGYYSMTNLYQGSESNFLAAISAGLAGYAVASTNFTLIANQLATLDFHLVKNHFAWLRGTVLDEATLQPIPGALVSGAVSDGDGGFLVSPFIIGAGLTIPLTLHASATGYWDKEIQTTVAADQTNIIVIHLLKICSGATIIGTVVNAQTQQPITNATVVLASYGTTTDNSGSFVLHDITVGADNTPLPTTVTASAPGFISDSKLVTVFCGATIVLDFGRSANGFGNIEGFVTNLLTGLPLTNVFMGSDFGGAAQTDAAGHYFLTNAPLGVAGADRVWKVTAAPTNFIALTESVVVTSNQTARLDFGFGAAINPPTVQLQIVTPISLNRQTGLYEQTIRFNNFGATALPGIRILIQGLPANAIVYNASGSSNSMPFVEYAQPIVSGRTVDFLLEYYLLNRPPLPIADPGFVVEIATSPSTLSPAGKPFDIVRNLQLRDGRFMIEFTSIPGRTYVIEYSADLSVWNPSRPALMAAGTRVQWLDDGPPKTIDKPANLKSRYYRIILQP